MSRIFYYGVPAVGHINPTLPLLAELVRNGQQVVAYNTEAYRAKFEATGAEFRAYPSVPEADELMQGTAEVNFARNAARLLDITRKLLPGVLEDLQKEQPALVIYDCLATWGRAGAEKLGLKTVSLISTFVLTPSMTFQLLPLRVMLDMSLKALPYFPGMMSKQRALSRDFGIPGEALSNPLLCTGQLNIIFTTRELQPKQELFGKDYLFIGASVTEREEKLDFTLDKKRPVVYISLGTINNQNFDFYRQCFEAFSSYPATFVLSAGKQTDISKLGPIPTNFIVRNYVAQLDLLKQTTVYISHAGMNSVHESLYYGVPLVLVPQQGEQLLVAMQVQKLEAGEAIGTKPPFGKTTASELRGALEKVMATHRQYKMNAENLGRQIKDAGGPRRAVSEILKFLV